MKEHNTGNTKRSLTRREFAKRGLILFTAAGASGMAVYGICNAGKIRTIGNVKRIGHCAPSIMHTLLDMKGIQNENMILYSGGMAGGIAGQQTECGVLTAPLMFLGFIEAEPIPISDKLMLISKAQSYVNSFNAWEGTSACGSIRAKGMKACRKTMYNFQKQFLKAISNPPTLSDSANESYSFLLNAFHENKFHCAHNVFSKVGSKFQITRELLDSSWIFIGGIAMLNMTCGALAAGVMALSSETAEIENSFRRVAKMNRMLRKGDNEAMNEEINNFNSAINLSDELGSWFMNEFGSLKCRDIWGLDFADKKDSVSFISGNCMLQCSYIAKRVAQKVNMMI